MASTTDAYAQAQDTVTRFLTAACEVDDSMTNGTTTTALHRAYVEWCASENIYRRDQVNRSGFALALDRLGFPSVRQSRGMVHLGLTLVETAAPQMATVPQQAEPQDPNAEERKDSEIARLKSLIAAQQTTNDDTTDTDA